MDLTIAVLTRNHAASLSRALASVAGLGTILVADTGSTDATLSLAHAAGAHVVHIPWADNFAAACNQTLAAIPTGWVLWMNPDEELRDATSDMMESAVHNGSSFAYRLRVAQQLRPDSPDFGTADFEVRLFRNDPSIRYTGRVHPIFDPPLSELARQRGQLIPTLGASLRRHAYLSPTTPDKLRWMVKLLELDLLDTPQRLSSRIELGRLLLDLGEAEAERTLLTAAEVVLRQAGDKDPPGREVGRLLETALQQRCPALSNKLPASIVRTLAEKWFAGSPPVWWALARERFAAGDFATAAQDLERLVVMGRTGQYQADGGFDPTIIGSVAQLNLGICYVHLKQYPKALHYLGPLERHPKFGEQAQRLLRFAHIER